MGMMTDGLKLAAGPALRGILAAATRTRWHALGSGMLVTALVQSSSAITVATIGFINAGLLGLAPALWVLFGANVGSTMTGWLVAVVGLQFKIEALALPLVGAGVLLRLTGPGRRGGAVGTAVAGFGLLFMGIGLLQQSFTSIAGQISLAAAVSCARGRPGAGPVSGRHRAADTGAGTRRAGARGRPHWHIASRMARAALAGVDAAVVASDQHITAQLDRAVERFVERMSRAAMAQGTGERLAWALRVLRYHETTCEQAVLASRLLPWEAATGTELALAQARFALHANALFALCDPTQGEPSCGMLAAALDAQEQTYQSLKAVLLDAGAHGRIPLAAMEQALRRGSGRKWRLSHAVPRCRAYGHVFDVPRLDACQYLQKTGSCRSKTVANDCYYHAPIFTIARSRCPLRHQTGLS